MERSQQTVRKSVERACPLCRVISEVVLTVAITDPPYSREDPFE